MEHCDAYVKNHVKHTHVESAHLADLVKSDCDCSCHKKS